jgi:hypothetical protein
MKKWSQSSTLKKVAENWSQSSTFDQQQSNFDQTLIIIYFFNEISLFCNSEKWPKIDPNLPLWKSDQSLITNNKNLIVIYFFNEISLFFHSEKVAENWSQSSTFDQQQSNFDCYLFSQWDQLCKCPHQRSLGYFLLHGSRKLRWDSQYISVLVFIFQFSCNIYLKGPLMWLYLLFLFSKICTFFLLDPWC